MTKIIIELASAKNPDKKEAIRLYADEGVSKIPGVEIVNEGDDIGFKVKLKDMPKEMLERVISISFNTHY